MKVVCERELVLPEKRVNNFDDAILAVVAYSKYLAKEKPLIAKFVYRFLDCIDFIPEDSREMMKEHVMNNKSILKRPQKKVSSTSTLTRTVRFVSL